MRTRIFAALSALVLFAAGCAGDTGSGADTGSGSGPNSGANGMTVTVSEPAEGATVSVPFTVKADTSVPIGPTETGNHHLHIWFDSAEDNAGGDYDLVFSNEHQITELAPGNHVMYVSLRNANHSPAGVQSTVNITVGEGGGQPAPAQTTPAPAPTDDGGYGY